MSILAASTVHQVTATPSIVRDVAVLAIATAIGALLIWIGRTLTKLVQRQSAIHDQVLGIPEVGYPSMRDQFAEVREHLCKQDGTLDKLEHEVQDNSGSSLKDAVKVVNRAVNDLSKKVVDLDAKLEKHIETINNKNN